MCSKRARLALRDGWQPGTVKTAPVAHRTAVNKGGETPPGLQEPAHCTRFQYMRATAHATSLAGAAVSLACASNNTLSMWLQGPRRSRFWVKKLHWQVPS